VKLQAKRSVFRARKSESIAHSAAADGAVHFMGERLRLRRLARGAKRNRTLAKAALR
jgi:hypothetical protein